MVRERIASLITRGWGYPSLSCCWYSPCCWCRSFGPSIRRVRGRQTSGASDIGDQERPCIRRRNWVSGRPPAADSDQAPPRHMKGSAQGCYLPVLTRFTDFHCVGLDPQRRLPATGSTDPSLGRHSVPLERFVGTGHRYLPT